MNQKAASYHTLALSLTFFILLGIGMANLYSAGADTSFFNSQVRHVVLGFIAFFLFGWLFPIRHLNTYAYPFFAFVCLALIVVLIMGHTAGGSQRWIILGPIRFQPSEIAKLATALAVAKFFYLHRSVVSFSLRDLWPLLVGCALVFILIFEQPDFGTAGVCFLIAFSQIVFIRMRIGFRTVISLAAGSISAAVIGWLFFLHDYQKLRVLNLLNPNLDPTGSGYNSIQSLVAIGSGKQFGKGFLQGTQTQLQFLPARHTDFIFSVFAEEHGFWGCTLVFVLFCAVAYIALEIAREAKDSFCALTAIGLAALLFVEFTINVAMVLGLFPVVGIPLPFFSYGGSALLTACIVLGILVAIDKENARSSRSNRLGSI